MQYLEDIMFDAEAIRDTSSHTSVSVNSHEMPVKTIIVNNDLNQTATLQMQGSRDNASWFNIGSTWDVSANTWAYQTCDTFFPYGRIIVICSVAPASGGLSAWCEKVRY